jgi:hypothetical protein
MGDRSVAALCDYDASKIHNIVLSGLMPAKGSVELHRIEETLPVMKAG